MSGVDLHLDGSAVGDGVSSGCLQLRRERRLLLLALALLVGISVYLIEVEREATWRSAEDGVLNVALGLQVSSTRTLEHSLSSLQRFALGVHAPPASREQTLAALRDAIAIDPVSAFLGVATPADGRIVIVGRSGEEARPEMSAAAAALVPAPGRATAQDAGPMIRPFISLPNDPEAYLPIGLRLPDGAMAFALVAARSLMAGTESMRLIPDGWATWVRPDGARLLEYSRARGEVDVNGPTLPASFLRLRSSTFGTFSAVDPSDGLPYLIGYSRSATLPFVVSISAPRAALFREWLSRALAPAVVLLFGTGAVLIFWLRLRATLLRQQKLLRQREQMLRELQELAGRLLSLQDDERRRIGRELHDSTVQLLAVLEFNLDRLVASADSTQRNTRALLKECVALEDQCSAELRTTSYLLHPPLLDELGLLSALRWLADGLRQRSDIRVELDLPQSTQRLPRELELPLFRVAQEALNNVHRHSRSPTVVIRLRVTGKTVTLEVEDAGCGILDDGSQGPAIPLPSAGIGLGSMQLRMRQLGGKLTIETSAKGTCVRAQLMLAGKPGISGRAAAG